MSASHEIYIRREWIYKHKDVDGSMTREFADRLEEFMINANQLSIMQKTGNMSCPCRKCKIGRYFLPKRSQSIYIIEGSWQIIIFGFGMVNETSTNSSFQHEKEPNITFEPQQFDYNQQNHNKFEDMVYDAFHETTTITDNHEEPNLDARQFYFILDAANQPIYNGCKEGMSRLSVASRMMNIKTDNNLSEICMDSWVELINDILPEDNLAPESYYEMIDVCIDNCMIFWKEDDQLQECRFCGKPRYKLSSGRIKISYQRMWYLPITDRLK